MSGRGISADAIGDLNSATLDRWAETIGEDNALRLSMIFGGRQLYIPVKPQFNSELVRAIGLEPARRLARRAGGTFVHVPRGAGERARIILLRRAGKRVSEIAAAVGCTERHVYYVLASYRERGGLLPTGRSTRARPGPRKDREQGQLGLFEPSSGDD